MAARLTTYLVVAIVSATLIAGLIVGAQRNDTDGPIDIIVHNARVYTADSGATAEAVAIRGNQILRVGGEREIMRLERPQTVVIDARGGTVVPGFNDTNAHPIEGGLALDAIDLAGAADLAEIQARIRAWCDANPDRAWAIGRGWDSSLLPQDTSPRQWLDSAVPDVPAAILSADGTTTWANTKAVKQAGTSSASGILTGAEREKVTAAQPRPSRAARFAALHAAVTEAHRLGITSLQQLAAPVEDLDLYAQAQREGELGIRIYAAVALNGAISESEIARLDALANKYPDDPLLKAGAVALAIDGSVAAGTAATLDPLPDKADLVQPLLPADDLNRTVRLLDARGWQVVAHASGDRAVRMALDAFEHAARSNPVPARGRRHRIDGAELIAAADLPRLKPLGVVLGMSAPESIGAPAASAKGARVVMASHWPSGAWNPMFGIQRAVTAAEPIGLKRAIDALTSSAAFASFDDHRKGTLKAGMLADLVVLSSDIFAIPPSAIDRLEVATTIFDGRIVYQRDRKTHP